MAGKLDLRPELSRPYDRTGFVRDVLRPVFGPGRLQVYTAAQSTAALTATDKKLAQSAVQYASLTLDDGTEVRCLEVRLQPRVRPEQSRVGIQALVRRLLTVGQAALVSFVPAEAEMMARPWRFTLVAKDAALNPEGKVVEQTNNARRYTYLLGPGQACRTPADRLRQLAAETDVTLDALVKAFEVEVLSKEFFKEYKRHYEAFCQELAGSNFKKSVFKEDEKAIRDFVKKLLGRLVFLYFVQKKGWLGASSTQYLDGDQKFLTNLFHGSGGNATFYPVWLSRLFFETLNQDETVNPRRAGDAFQLPDGRQVCIPFLNGGLFDRDAHDHAKYQLTLFPTLFHQPGRAEVPGQRGFLDFLDAYNFTVQEDSPDEHVVAVDPEMLGNIFENLLEDNKDKGAFYTPKEIVHYMCRESLVEYLDTRLNVFEVPLGTAAGKGLKAGTAPAPKAGQLALTTTENRSNIQRRELEDFVREKHANAFIKQHAAELDKLLDTVKICDPAIGSGAFPMGLLHEIYLCKLVLKDLTQVQHSSLFHERDHLADPGRFHADVKLGIIQNSIYGVDIERGAVDIARLRFWLSLVVDEDRPRALPNLDYKIVVGNSLVSKLDGETLTLNWNLKAGTGREQRLREQYVALGELQAQFFTKAGTKKQQLQATIRNAKIDLLLAQVELEVEKLPKPQATMFGSSAKQQATDLAALTKWQGYEAQARKLRTLRADATRALPYFDWRLDFPEVLNPHVTDEPGFDIVIGNPPYVNANDLKKALGAVEYQSLKTGFVTAKGTLDLYVYFFEQAIKITKSHGKGQVVYITPNKYLSASYAEALREFMLENVQITQLIDYSDTKVFKTAAVYPVVVLLRKIAIEANYNFRVGKYTELTNQISERTENSKKLRFLEGFIWGYLLNEKISITEKVINQSKKIEEAGKINATSTASEADNYHYLINDKKGLKIINTGTIDKYVALWGQCMMTDKGEKYLKPLLDIDSSVVSLNRRKLYKSPKIIFAKMASTMEAFLDESGEYASINTNCLHSFSSGYEPKFVLAWVNSRLFQFTYECFFEALKMQGGYMLYSAPNIQKMSIKDIDKIRQKPFVSIVNQILAAKAASATANTSVLEAEIDRLVYRPFPNFLGQYYTPLLSERKPGLSARLPHISAYRAGKLNGRIRQPGRQTLLVGSPTPLLYDSGLRAREHRQTNCS